MIKKAIIFSIIILSITIILTVVFLSKKKEEFITKTSQEKDEIGIGILTNQNNEEFEKYEKFVEYLNKHTNDNWKVIPIKNYSSFLGHIKKGDIKAGFMGSVVGYKLIIENIAIPLVRGEKNGISTYQGYIFTRKDSGFNKIEDLSGKRFAYVDPYTSAGYLFPVFLLKDKGYNPDEFYKVSSFLDSHEKTITAVLNKNFDSGATKDLIWKKLSKTNPNIENELQVIEKEGPFPENTLMISTEFNQTKLDKLQKLLLDMHKSEEGRRYLLEIDIDKFIITKKEDFNLVEKITDL
ncbi:MAG: phosphate/phosphite/phosphonate ABC transporter substrate-binding protein [Patescibacteria group bacterium]|nr:phosphate/phosphite/phosphonate ABC transporter substrate-binding protein [Patescibacteria group bacterium]